MRDINFGKLSGRQMTLRLFAPSYFERWDYDSSRYGSWNVRLSPWKLLNPLAWWKSIFRGRYDWWWVHHPDCNHRCYCPVGAMCDFSLVVAGWGVVVFYSYYGGEVPCHCDKVISELFPDEDDEAEFESNPQTEASK